ncbi:hypothetical protein [Micromonospora sp.]
MTAITSRDATTAPARWQDRTGRILMALTAAVTLVPFVDGISRINAATGDQVLMEFWRTFAYIVFAGMWALLAVAPRQQRGMWELLLFHKIAVSIQAAFVIDVPNAGRTLIAD